MVLMEWNAIRVSNPVTAPLLAIVNRREVPNGD